MAKVKFQVVLENVDLSKTQVASIQKEINAVVTKSLLSAKKPMAAALPSTLGFKIPPEWIGIYIKNFRTLDLLKVGGFKVLR
jgi:hypothetical protein